ncbi:pyruvate dehydrogenase (acetyl-transferring) E1 component subunit alpha [Ktedonospora formicarum]|uniref:Pyruvate dehydrogenase E1 component subunit alpha n=1 Tax=Ktedonospora formicarum TaxID=2778364 RepID=A0A8J3MP14_9CHLR|nr:pyruvate dehydrogenase (acetyl-transferring) E1 component subunit alpha [Ktedonospora formicarum]GHO43362.1 pyruvate dehydrogenase E1 component subunit alpha [Ktedonospora formicarum]
MNTEQKKRSKASEINTSRMPDTAALANEDKSTLLKYYYEMVLIRRFEEKSGEMYNKARIGGYCHLNLGEEATVVGFCHGLQPEDYIYANYREHGYALSRGIPSNAVMAELFGKATGITKGRGGSMHLFDVTRHFMGGYGIVGGQVPLAVGAAYAIKYRDGKGVVACQMGDGATNGGPFYESLNMAKIYKLPVIFFIVNNQYGMGTRVEAGSAVAELYRKGCAFDINSVRVDGTDVLAVRDAMLSAAKLAREKSEPSIIEAVSYRFRGHSVVDPDRYRDRDEVQRSRETFDPISKYTEQLKAAGILDDAKINEVAEQVEREVVEAVDFAEASPFPSLDTLYDYIYAEDTATH